MIFFWYVLVIYFVVILVIGGCTWVLLYYNIIVMLLSFVLCIELVRMWLILKYIRWFKNTVRVNNVYYFFLHSSWLGPVLLTAILGIRCNINDSVAGSLFPNRGGWSSIFILIVLLFKIGYPPFVSLYRRFLIAVPTWYFKWVIFGLKLMFILLFILTGCINIHGGVCLSLYLGWVLLYITDIKLLITNHIIVITLYIRCYTRIVFITNTYMGLYCWWIILLLYYYVFFNWSSNMDNPWWHYSHWSSSLIGYVSLIWILLGLPLLPRFVVKLRLLDSMRMPMFVVYIWLMLSYMGVSSLWFTYCLLWI